MPEHDIFLAYRLLKDRQYLLAVHVIRDLPITQDLGLDKQAWMYDHHGCSYHEAYELLVPIFKHYETERRNQAWAVYNETGLRTIAEEAAFNEGFKKGMEWQGELQYA